MHTENLMEIQQRYNIDEERFLKGHKFAMMIADGERSNTAYAEAFEVPFSSAKGLSNQLYRSKWIQEIIKEISVDNELRDREHIEDIKQSMAAIMDDEKGIIDLKDKIAAARVLKDTIQSQPKQQEDVKEVVDNRLSEILNHIASTARQEEIEVKVIE